MKRSKWKGFFIKTINYEKPFNLSTKISRNSTIIPKFINKTFKIHNGKSFKEISVTKEMVGHKFGEFFKTRANFEFKKRKKKK